MTSATAAETMRQVFATQVAPTLVAIAPDNPAPRAVMMGSFVIGLATTRYALEVPVARALDRDLLIQWARPVIRQILFGPAPD
jgi:multisubunit Na+/H+ antiporter MnhC subunit